MEKGSMRTVMYRGTGIHYRLQRKKVKNINLRIRPDGSVWVSAPRCAAVQGIDAFVQSKGEFILNAIGKFAQMQKNAPQPLRCETGEKLKLIGREVVLQVVQGAENAAVLKGDTLLLTVKNMEDTEKKQRLIKAFTDRLCKEVFSRAVEKAYPAFEKLGVAMPALKIRDMKSRWGSCLVHKGTVTLNRRLIEKPVSCIEYVAVHELCHFIHPNHSKDFYALLTEMLPGWEEQRELLNKA